MSNPQNNEQDVNEAWNHVLDIMEKGFDDIRDLALLVEKRRKNMGRALAIALEHFRTLEASLLDPEQTERGFYNAMLRSTKETLEQLAVMLRSTETVSPAQQEE
jgi:hypothetical protein